MRTGLWTVAISPPGEEQAVFHWNTLRQVETHCISLANRHGDDYMEHVVIRPPSNLQGTTNARYARGKKVIQVATDGSGFKTRAARLAEAKGIGGKWVHRNHGYTVSATAAARFEKLYAAGWDANFITGELQPSRTTNEP